MIYVLANRVRKRAGIQDYSNGGLHTMLCRVVYDAIVRRVNNFSSDAFGDTCKLVISAQEVVMLADMFAEDE